MCKRCKLPSLGLLNVHEGARAHVAGCDKRLQILCQDWTPRQTAWTQCLNPREHNEQQTSCTTFAEATDRLPLS